MKNTLSIIIPNFNGRQLLEKNLPLVLEAVGKSQVVIVDDGSTDESAEFIKKHFPGVTLIEKVTNSGFATSVNLGVKAAKGDIVFLLNSDAVPQKNCLVELVKHFQDGQVFAVGCLDESIEDNRVVKRGRGIGKFTRGFLIHTRGETNKTNTLWASGGSSAFRKSIWEKLGGMDELYNPFYWEDIDLSYRALKSGYLIVFESKAIVTHRHGEGSIQKAFSEKKIKQIAYRNQFIFVWKNINSKSYILKHFLWLPYHLFAAIMRGDWPFLVGFLLVLVQFREISRRSQYQFVTFTKTDEDILSQFNSPIPPL